MADDEDDPSATKIGAEIVGAMDEEFHDAPDRVIAIVGASYLDEMLAQILRAVFVDDKEAVENLIGQYGPIGTNGARYSLAYCLGLITREERDDLKAIADIRNKFAHQFAVRSFDHQVPTKYVGKLHLGKQFDAIVADLVKSSDDPVQQAALREIGGSGRRKFQDAVRHLFGVLLLKLQDVQRASRDTWYPRAGDA